MKEKNYKNKQEFLLEKYAQSAVKYLKQQKTDFGAKKFEHVFEIY